jgi:very-short-patch-repair endonuclease
MKSNAEIAFQTLWHILGGPDLIEEYRFHPVRRWRFDFAIPASHIAIEIDGGGWTRGRHHRPGTRGFDGDLEKLNEAIRLGWRVFRLTPAMFQNDPDKHIQPIIDFITKEASK